MEVVAGFLVVGLVVAIAAFVVAREAGRIAKRPPPALFDLEDAFKWVVAHVPDDVAASLTPDDVRRILDFQVEYFKRKGVSANGSTAYPAGTVVIGGAETVDYILERCAADGGGVPPRAGVRRARDAAQLPAHDRRHRAGGGARLAVRRRRAPARLTSRRHTGESTHGRIGTRDPRGACGTSFGTRERRWSIHA